MSSSKYTKSFAHEKRKILLWFSRETQKQRKPVARHQHQHLHTHTHSQRGNNKSYRTTRAQLRSHTKRDTQRQARHCSIDDCSMTRLLVLSSAVRRVVSTQWTRRGIAAVAWTRSEEPPLYSYPAQVSEWDDPLDLLRHDCMRHGLCDEAGFRKPDVHWTFSLAAAAAPSDNDDGKVKVSLCVCVCSCVESYHPPRHHHRSVLSTLLRQERFLLCSGILFMLVYDRFFFLHHHHYPSPLSRMYSYLYRLASLNPDVELPACLDVGDRLCHGQTRQEQR